MGKTAVMITVCIADTAQSYIAQARNSRRWRPSASRMPRDGAGGDGGVVTVVMKGPGGCEGASGAAD